MDSSQKVLIKGMKKKETFQLIKLIQTLLQMCL